MQESGFNPKTFLGVRFALVGFNPTHGNSLRSKLVSGGGVDVGQCSQSCTHLIVDKLVYDDPICVAARSSGKVVVTGSWVGHSFDTGMLVHANSVLYKPLRDLNGVPGSKTLVVCLTGYQGQDREDIMAMVDLMGGNFSKPLVANRVTHLICYKFEGEKYELAKRMKKIKVVNHRWLEDCLKNWKLLPEVEYEIRYISISISCISGRLELLFYTVGVSCFY
ncbi:PREDICTED: BRCT domain-containing protein At4g02110-like [Camelina sativa]|uniref:BRCT domain-containing protein At4g02110-like n=1 Tax=Camelina sativa TaxID=90675 RepID=A0ABM0VJ17_CAMSA|nr:PREDICTED: BRCT domain-containing protein At4g02110-like [Camelina sativa]XP_010456982.1 PREDICTED: BRCT domain-containing protein At4g02110-like [Camelina sativa]